MKYYLMALARWNDFKGVSNRKEYWYFVLFNFIFGAFLSIFKNYFLLPYVVYALIVFIPGVSLSVRRLHDVGVSGWWLFVLFIPYIGILILFVLYILPTKIENKYNNVKNIKVDRSNIIINKCKTGELFFLRDLRKLIEKRFYDNEKGVAVEKLEITLSQLVESLIDEFEGFKVVESEFEMLLLKNDLKNESIRFRRFSSDILIEYVLINGKGGGDFSWVFNTSDKYLKMYRDIVRDVNFLRLQNQIK